MIFRDFLYFYFRYFYNAITAFQNRKIQLRFKPETASRLAHGYCAIKIQDSLQCKTGPALLTGCRAFVSLVSY